MKKQPWGNKIVSYFIKNINVDLTIKSSVESGMKGILQVVNVETLLIVIFDGFDGGQFALVNPVHEFPRSSFLVSDLLNFVVKERLLHCLDFVLENFPIL